MVSIIENWLLKEFWFNQKSIEVLSYSRNIDQQHTHKLDNYEYEWMKKPLIIKIGSVQNILAWLKLDVAVRIVYAGRPFKAYCAQVLSKVSYCAVQLTPCHTGPNE